MPPFCIENSILAQCKLLGYKNIENWYPSKIDISLSEAVIKDKVLFNNLKKVINDNPGIILSPYSYTKKLKSLIDALEKEKLIFKVDQQSNQKSEQLVDYLGSKVGFRTEIKKIPEIPQLDFFIVTTKLDIIESVVNFYKHNTSCVVKAYSGERSAMRKSQTNL